MDLTRRDLIRSSVVLAGGTCACAAATTVACCTLPLAPPEAISFEKGVLRVALHRAPELANAGGALRYVDEQRKLKLIIARPEKNKVVAVSQTCTHGGGPLTYVHKHRLFHCTCWGHSKFSLDGSVLYWPNKDPGKPLKVFEVLRTGESTIEVRVEA